MLPLLNITLKITLAFSPFFKHISTISQYGKREQYFTEEALTDSSITFRIAKRGLNISKSTYFA